MTTHTTPINSIQIPQEYVDLCASWYQGQDCMLYVVASTGNLTLGTIRPHGIDTDEEWYLNLWDSLLCDIRHIIRSIKKPSDCEDYILLLAFADWVGSIVDKLRVEYDQYL